MPDSTPPDSTPPAAELSRVAARLRAAGCVFAEDEARLLLDAARSPAELEALLARRGSGAPLEHILGWAEFLGQRIALQEGVFVPRRRTEFLVHRAAHLARERPGDHRLVALDLCCGSGAVGTALAARLAPVDIYAVDIDPAAVRCARRNLGGAARVYAGDLFEPLPAALHGQVDVIVANAPYVPTAAIALMPPEARLHEARAALDGGADGLDVQRRIIAGAPPWLAAGGHLLIETGDRQAQETAAAMRRRGMTPRIDRSEALNATIVIGNAGRESA